MRRRLTLVGDSLKIQIASVSRGSCLLNRRFSHVEVAQIIIVDAAARGLWIGIMSNTAGTMVNNNRLVDACNVVLFAGSPTPTGTADAAFRLFIVRSKRSIHLSSFVNIMIELHDHVNKIYLELRESLQSAR